MCWSLWQPCHVNLSIGTVLYWISVPLFNIYYHSTATRWVFIIFWNFFLLGIRNSKEKLLVNCLCFWWKKRKLAKASRWMWTKCFQGYAVFRWTAYPFCVPLWQKSAYSWLRKVRTLEGYAKKSGKRWTWTPTGFVVVTVGLEPTTPSMWTMCSTDWAMPPYMSTDFRASCPCHIRGRSSHRVSASRGCCCKHSR